MYDMQFVATSSAGWAQAIAVVNALNDRPLGLDGIAIELEIQSCGNRRELSASTADGTIERPRPDVIQWRFSPDQMRNLRVGATYQVGCLAITPGGATQLFIGTLALIDGEVS